MAKKEIANKEMAKRGNGSEEAVVRNVWLD